MQGTLPYLRAAATQATILVALVLAACSSTPPTTSAQDPDTDFSRFKTYAFLMDLADDPSSYQSLEATYLKTAVTREMDLRGFTRVDSDPELAINFSIETQEKVRSRSVPTAGYGIGYDPFFDVYGTGWGMTHTTEIDQYTEGRLNIDAIDVAAKKLVWQGSTKGRITRSVEENWESTLHEAVTEIFTQFPVPAPEAPATK